MMHAIDDNDCFGNVVARCLSNMDGVQDGASRDGTDSR